MAINLIGPLNSGTAAGGAGVATANADSTVVVKGIVKAVYLTYNDSPPAGTTDVTLSTKGTSPAPGSVTILAKANSATDAWYYPTVQHCGASDGAAIANEYVKGVPVHDLVNVLIAQANNGDSVDAWLLVEQ